MSFGPLTREQIIVAYEILFGRSPESDETIEYHVGNNRSLKEFREKMLISTEFQSEYASLMKKRYGDGDPRANVLTPQQIIIGYETVLGRSPDSDEIIQHHLASNRNIEEFREKVLISAEFQSKYSALVENRYADAEQRSKVLGFDENVGTGLSFLDFFESTFAPRLQKRAATYRAAYRYLLQHRQANVTVLETGCLRSAGNWSGDGQSTVQFEHLVRKCGGTAISVDSSPVSIAIAGYFCPTVQLVLSDSVKYLEFLSERASGLAVDLLYLDSMDIDLANPKRSAQHHLRELVAAWPLLRKGSLVLIDDHDCETDVGRVSKSTLANEWIADRAGKIAEGYQIVWAVS